MNIYIVQNSENVLLATFKTKNKAQKFISKIGNKAWNESWVITKSKLNHVQKWLKNGK